MLRYTRGAVMLTLGLLGIGCGKGLTLNLSAIPDPANPGQSVTWTLSVRNDSLCETTGEMTELPDPLPDTAGAFALIVGFNPELEEFGPTELCRLFMTTTTLCNDEECLGEQLGEAFGPEVAAALIAQAHAAMEGEPQPAGSCVTVINDSDGFAAICAFDPLSPGETDTAMHTDTAPDTGNHHAAQLAIAFAPALGDDCRPGREVESGVWTLAGCFPTAVTEPAPALSPLGLGAGAVLLIAAGVLGLRRKRSS